VIEMTLAEVAEVTGGTLADADPRARVTGEVEFDSRRVGPGGLFVAFVGQRVDGHDFARAAVAAGAVAVMGTRRVDGVPMVLVADPLAALAALARAVVNRLDGLTVVGLTGSSGKTTTKDLTAQLVSRLGATVAPVGSFNNELGHPYTVLKARPETRFLVLEKATRGPGHISYLCRVAPPHIGVVLNVGVSHIGGFGSVEAIAAAKGELVEALPPDGLAVLNLDDPNVAAMARRTSATVLGYAVGPDAHRSGNGLRPAVRATDVVLDERGRASFRLETPEGSARVRLAVPGAHQVGNSLAAAAVARHLGMPLEQVAEALGEATIRSPRRMDVYDRPDGVTVIDDSYNANPASMAVALRALAAIGRPSAGPRRRTVAVLGYMAELGHHERAGHEQVGALAADLEVDLLVVVGDAAAGIHHGAVSRDGWGGEAVLVADQDEAVAVLRERLRGGEVVLVKGSRYRTWEVADWLRAAEPHQRQPVEAAS
jgi:UDP-N-acetylmuramoyl-tripeptide--D-alanyl-D-alanine ligase